MIAPDTVHGGMSGISVRVFTLTAGEVVCSWQCIYGISPRGGGGSTGRGVEHPPPLSPASLVERYSPTTPTARPLPRPPPAPSRGRAVWDDSPDTVHGGMNGISVRVIALTAERLSVPGSVSTGYHPRGGGARRGGGRRRRLPLPCLRVSSENLSPSITPPARERSPSSAPTPPAFSTREPLQRLVDPFHVPGRLVDEILVAFRPSRGRIPNESDFYR